jgi:hypothetical protein
VCLIALAAVSCKDLVTDQGSRPLVPISPDSPLTEQVAQSLSAWKEKDDSLAAYQYSTSFFSWSGYHHQTTITVRKDQVEERLYQEYFGDSLSNLWIEHHNSVGSYTEGATPLTIDSLYQICSQSLVNIDTSAYDVNLSFFNNNLLRSCTYRHKNCADDCIQGIQIDSILFLPEKNDGPDICTEIYVTLNITVVNTRKQPVVLDSFYTLAKGDTLFLKEGYASGMYEVITDLYSDSFYEQRDVVYFVGFYKGNRYQEPMLVSSDGCHIQKEAGRDTLIVSP